MPTYVVRFKTRQNSAKQLASEMQGCVTKSEHKVPQLLRSRSDLITRAKEEELHGSVAKSLFLRKRLKISLLISDLCVLVEWCIRCFTVHTTQHDDCDEVKTISFQIIYLFILTNWKMLASLYVYPPLFNLALCMSLKSSYSCAWVHILSWRHGLLVLMWATGNTSKLGPKRQVAQFSTSPNH